MEIIHCGVVFYHRIQLEKKIRTMIIVSLFINQIYPRICQLIRHKIDHHFRRGHHCDSRESIMGNRIAQVCFDVFQT